MKLRNIQGQQFGRLTVLQRSYEKRDGVRWLCRCECGQNIITSSKVLLNGSTKSCGCLRNEKAAARQTTHGLTSNGRHAREFRSWVHARERCYNTNNKNYALYGGRGITICDRWRNSFAAFLEDMGASGPGLTLDRKDSNGNYEPGNCRWATQKQQCRNRRNSVRVIWQNEKLQICDLADRLSLKSERLKYFFCTKGLSIEEAVRIASSR